MIPSPSKLPIEAILSDVEDAFDRHTRIVISAPPGAGKTTRIPPALLTGSWLGTKKVLMLEPRRLAARSAAEFMSGALHETVGKTVGYRIRGDARVSSKTRIEIVTEGILTRRLIQEQDLEDVGAVLFDEFHERSIHADMGLALTLDLQRHLRKDLRIAVMSATLDVERIAALLENPPIVRASGRAHKVDVHYTGSGDGATLETRMAQTIARAVRNHEGDVLAFLPGIGEIRRTEERLRERGLPDGTVVHLLYGDLGYDQQRAALTPSADGRQKVILSTSIAETSLTIEGVTVVVDSGLARTIQYDPGRGMTGLVTVPVSKAIAEQRKGRAGRQVAGTCYRLWTKDYHASLPEFPLPEIKSTDLTHVALELAAWGDPTGGSLAFIDPPPSASIERSRGLLRNLGALDASGKLTVHGRRLARLPVHPRYAHMIVRADELGHGPLACDLAALLEERDLFAAQRDRDIDLTLRVLALQDRGQKARQSPALQERIRDQARRFRSMASIKENPYDADATGLVLALAYPDRVGRRKRGTDQYLLVSGKTAEVPKRSVLDKHEFLAVGHVDGIGSIVRILLAAPLTAEDVAMLFADQICEEQDVHWDAATSAVVARTVRKAGSMILEERPLMEDSPEKLDALLQGIRAEGLDSLPWDKPSVSLRDRVEWIRKNDLADETWPDSSPSALLNTLEEWLAPFLGGVWKLQQLKNLDMVSIMSSRFTHAQRRAMHALAPTHIRVPSGSDVRLSYEDHVPVLPVKLQEMFGLTETPRIGGGKVPVRIHLLSPANRPLAVTQDLASFWKNVYPEIRGQLRAKYPKHPWPEDPLRAEPTRRTVQRRKR